MSRKWILPVATASLLLLTPVAALVSSIHSGLALRREIEFAQARGLEVNSDIDYGQDWLVRAGRWWNSRTFETWHVPKTWRATSVRVSSVWVVRSPGALRATLPICPRLLAAMEELQLNHEDIGDADLPSLAHAARLKHVTIKPNQLTDAGLKSLSRCSSLETLVFHFPNPNYKNRKATKLTAAGLGEVAQLPRLKTICLYPPQFDDDALVALWPSRSLRMIKFSEHLASPTVEEFRQSHPGCKISAPDQAGIRVRNLPSL